jgi:hypothetical protein
VCPDLQPTLMSPINPPPNDGSGVKFFLFTRGMNHSFVEAVVDDIAAALIRDKAVWWLAHKDAAPTVSSAATHYSEDGSPPVDTMWAVEGCFEDGNGQEEEREEVLSSDPTHALYLAVCKMLNIDTDTTT